MISVIIPVYNTEAYLEKCLRSVLEQTCQEFEIVVVDDGSTDSSPEICRAFAAQDSRVRFYRQSHQGVSAARNMALDKAQGDPVFFLDSDDYIHPSCLERLYGQMLLWKVKMAFSRQNRTVSGENCRITNEWILYDSHSLVWIFSNRNHIVGGIGGKLLAKDVLGTLRFEADRALGEDTIFLYELVKNGLDAAYTPDPLYVYRRREAGSARLRSCRRGLQEAGRVMKWLESEEQACGRTENARAWEGEYIRILHRAIEHLPKDELYAMQQEVAEELKNPYFRARPLRTRASVSLAFFCYPVYRFLRTVYRFCNLGGRKQT
ncbi:MAG: glycosyltransferase [Lachnospiraceae bacterium]|nr:glycosyltransferase [Lachnospiraceae bacterium]